MPMLAFCCRKPCWHLPDSIFLSIPLCLPFSLCFHISVSVQSCFASTMSTEGEVEEEEQEEEEEKEEEEEEEDEEEEEEIPEVSCGSPRWKHLLRGRESKNYSSVLLLRDLEVTGRLMLRVPQRLRHSPIYDNMHIPPHLMEFFIQSRAFWDSVDQNNHVLHMQAEWESQCDTINQELPAQILLTKNIATKNHIESVCLC